MTATDPGRGIFLLNWKGMLANDSMWESFDAAFHNIKLPLMVSTRQALPKRDGDGKRKKKKEKPKEMSSNTTAIF